MAKTRMDLASSVGKLLEDDDVDVLREGVRVLAQAIVEEEVSAQIGAGPHERTPERTAHRNGYRTGTWDTRVGTIELRVPKITPGSYFPGLLEPRRRAEVRAFRERPICEPHPYVWLDATFHKVRRDGRVVSAATVVAIGVSERGERHILGLDVGIEPPRVCRRLQTLERLESWSRASTPHPSGTRPRSVSGR